MSKTWHIHIQGQVQGVGFRPFIYQLAIQKNLVGWVSNSSDGVHIEINSTKSEAEVFLRSIKATAPLLAKITNTTIYPVEDISYADFTIRDSTQDSIPNLLFTPDIATCADCRRELMKPNDRRYNYPFITCTNCGPRYAILCRLPYDRPHTSMKPFRMCNACQSEYDNPNNRRHFAQTNSCPNCAIHLTLYDHDARVISHDVVAIISKIVNAWEEEKIVALKGIGGYLLTCDANKPSVLERLRNLKQRPSKPFALMYPSIEQLRKEAELSPKESASLDSISAPIVILDFDKPQLTPSARSLLAPGLDQLGVMLPYTPLHHLLLKKFNRPIVATSGNIHRAPILFEDEKAIAELGKIAELILADNRAIQIPQDDSVIRYSPFKRQKIILRRSRGLAPTYINPNLNLPKHTLLGIGADLKNTFTLVHRQNSFISQYLGDLEQFETQQNFAKTLNHFFTIFNSNPAEILCDYHPGYFSTEYAQNLSTELDIPVHSVQHHLAHFCAVLGEHNLFSGSDSVLGIVWDGAGLGTDGHIWGGEFFLFENGVFNRNTHFEYFPSILGDKMAREPRISAFAIAGGLEEVEKIIRPKFSDIEWSIYSKLLQKKDNLKTSSVGRLFDGVASILDLRDQQQYDGEAAMLLEKAALSYFKEHGLGSVNSYLPDQLEDNQIPTATIFQALLHDFKNGINIEEIAAKFHFTLVDSIAQVARRSKVKKLAFSGGVFQNGLLVDLIIARLEKEFELYFHQKLSPNDENISFGQIIHHVICNYSSK